MARRLSQLYSYADQVEIYLHGHWRPARVTGFAHPGLWVESGGLRWFVTNRSKIRRGGSEDGSPLAKAPER